MLWIFSTRPWFTITCHPQGIQPPRHQCPKTSPPSSIPNRPRSRRGEFMGLAQPLCSRYCSSWLVMPFRHLPQLWKRVHIECVHLGGVRSLRGLAHVFETSTVVEGLPRAWPYLGPSKHCCSNTIRSCVLLVHNEVRRCAS
jgi:hypothetical protein